MAGGLPPSRTGGPRLRTNGWFPPALGEGQQTRLKAAVQVPPRRAGIDLADWNWKVVRAFVEQHFGHLLCRSSCLNYLHRLGFVVKRPKKRLVKADEEKRAAFVALYAGLLAEAEAIGAKVFFVDEAHFRADADLRGKWVLKGEPALVDSTSPERKAKATYYSGVCLETGEVEVMEVAQTCTAQTSAAFLRQLRTKHPEPLIVIWDNGPAHHGDAIRALLATPGLNLRLVALPGYSPDFNADEAIWDWAREEVTANTCLGTKAKVQEKVDQFFQGLSGRTAEVKQRCRTVLQAKADALDKTTSNMLSQATHVDSTLALV
ncbi:MAG: IS630 family transposase [Chloroflexota bacterium]